MWKKCLTDPTIGQIQTFANMLLFSVSTESPHMFQRATSKCLFSKAQFEAFEGVRVMGGATGEI